MVDKQGHNAYTNGKRLEDQVETILNDLGIETIQYRDIGDDTSWLFVDNNAIGYLIRNVPYTNMFGKDGRGEFVLHLNGLAPIRIECRYQGVRGTVEDKLPKLLGDCKCMVEKTVFIILEGDGITPQAKKWLKTAAEAVAYKYIRVVSINAFEDWVYDTVNDYLETIPKYNTNAN